MRNLFVYLQFPKCIFADVLYYKTKKIKNHGKVVQNLINQDMEKYMPKKTKLECKDIKALNYLLVTNKIFRNIFYYRIEQDKKLQSTICKVMSMMLLTKLHNIEVCNDLGGFIDGGLKVVHTAGCTIVPYIAGKNLSVYQGVTIGNSLNKNGDKFGCPTIGDNVTIMANSVVCGNIKIGNNVTVGAGSVVTKDIPDNCTVVGNPAMIIKRDGVKVKEYL